MFSRFVFRPTAGHSHSHQEYAGKEPARIRIPSNPSSIGRMSTSSVERLSEHGGVSPMPNFHVEILSPGRPATADYSWTTTATTTTNNINNNNNNGGNSTGTMSKFKPNPDELRRVYIEKSSEPLGIQIFCRNSGGVFVSSVHQSSLAAQVK